LHTQSAYLPSPAIAAPPHWLSICSRLLPNENSNGLPAYVMLGDDGRTFPTPGPGFLGAEYQGLVCPGNGLPPSDLPRAGEGEIAAQDRRENLRRQLSQPFHQGRPMELVESHDVAFARMSTLMRRQISFDVT